MRRTLREWEQLWRERWDINDYADLDQVFAGTEDYQNVVCEVEILIGTQGAGLGRSRSLCSILKTPFWQITNTASMN